MSNILSRQELEALYPNLVNTAKKIEAAIIQYNKDGIVEKFVKSGARLQKIVLTVRNPNVQHVYLTKLYRKDISDQIAELKAYGLEVQHIRSREDVMVFDRFMQHWLDPNNKHGKDQIWIHFDESDYGTGDRQLLSPILKKYVLREDGVYFLNYSATNEEATLSAYGKHSQVATIRLEPGPNHKGPGWFLDNNLVKNSTPFWDFDHDLPTRQGEEATKLLLTPNSEKVFGIVRLSVRGQYRKAKESALARTGFWKYFDDLGIKVEFIDEGHPFYWAVPKFARPDDLITDWEHLYGKYLIHGTKYLLVINQTCTRSTELGFHQYLAFLHDHRPGKTPYGTIIQALGRVFHYHPVGHKIMVYGEVEAFKLHADRITNEEYYERAGRDISARTLMRQETIYQPFFFSEDDSLLQVSATGLGSYIAKFTDGRTVPGIYNRHPGKNYWAVAVVHNEGAYLVNDYTLNAFLGNRPRGFEQPMYLFDLNELDKQSDRVQWPNLLQKWSDEKTTCNNGELVVDVLNSGRKVFCYFDLDSVSIKQLTSTRSVFTNLKALKVI